MESIAFRRDRNARKLLRPSLEALERRDVPATWGFAWPMPQTMTISFVPDGTKVGELPSDLSSFGTMKWGSDWEVKALRALEAWTSNAEINVGLHADDGEPLGSPGPQEGSNNFGDIRVAAVPMASDVIASAIPFQPAAGTWSGDILLNSAYTGPAMDAYPVFLHELGHVFGFADNLDPTSVNYRYFSGSRTDLSASDIVALQGLYGARQPDAYEGPTGNDTLATASLLPFKPGEYSQTLAADLRTASDVDNYQVTLPAGSDELKVHLTTSGLSLLTGDLTVFDAAGSIVGTASATDPRSGDLTVHLARATAGQTYQITVRAADPEFGVGQYALGFETKAEETNSPPNALLQQYGSTYLLSILSDGASSNPSQFQAILRLLFASGGSSSLYSDSVQDDLAAYLSGAGSSPQATRSVGTLLSQILASQGSSQLDSSKFGPLFQLLNQSGVMEQVVMDVIKSGGDNAIIQSVISSGQVGQLLQELIDSGTLGTVLRGAVDSPEGASLLDSISRVVEHSFGGQPGNQTGKTGPAVLTAQNMIDFYTILLDHNELDPVIDSFLNSNLLYNSFASVSQEALAKSFQITLNLASKPDRLGADLRQFFGQVGFSLAPGLVTPDEGVAMIRALRGTNFFDEYFRALMNAGGLDEISLQMAASGAIDKVFSSYLTSKQVGDLFGTIVKSNLLPVLAQNGLLGKMIKSAIDADEISPLLEGLNNTGALPALLDVVLKSNALAPLLDALLTSDQFSGLLMQMFEDGQLGSITDAVASSGALGNAISSLLSSGQLTNLLGDILSLDSPLVASALEDLGTALLPKPATSFAEAIPLASATASGANDVRSLSAVGMINDANPFGMYKLVVPAIDGETPASMIVGAWRQKGTLVQPDLQIFDAQSRPVSFELLNNGDGTELIQVLDPTPGQTYYVMVREASAIGTGETAVFGIQAIFNDEPVKMDKIGIQTLDLATPQAEMTFVATDSRVYHWLLASQGIAGGVVQLTVLDSSGHLVQTMQAPAGGGASVDLLLDQGTYTLVFEQEGLAMSSDSSLDVTLTGFELSDLLKPYSSDPSLQPVGANVSTFTASPSSAGNSTETSSGLARLAMMDPSSHSYMATFGNQGGVGNVGVTIARGPVGPLRTLAAQGFGVQGERRTTDRSPIPAGTDQGSSGPIDAQILEFSEIGEASARTLASAARLKMAVPGDSEGLLQVPAAMMLSQRGFDLRSVLDRAGILTAEEHPHFLVGLTFLGGTVVARKLRKKQNHATRRIGKSDERSNDETTEAPDGVRRPLRDGRPSPFSGRRVLLIKSSGSPSPDDFQHFEGWLAEIGVEVLFVDRADQSKIVALQPDLILIEDRPPSFDGLEFLAIWQDKAEARRIPIILASEGDSSLTARALDLGAFDVFSPFIGLEVFRARLKAVFRLGDRLRHLETEASQDSLTGLANRAAFDSQIALDWVTCQKEDLPLTLVVIDVDHFKAINDNHGHAVGDSVLRLIASALTSSLRKGDIAARLGGDEFVILAPGCDEAGGESLTERIRRKIDNITIDGTSEPFRATVSIGITCIEKPGRTDPEEGLRRADLALYAAKSAGRNIARSWGDIENAEQIAIA